MPASSTVACIRSERSIIRASPRGKEDCIAPCCRNFHAGRLQNFPVTLRVHQEKRRRSISCSGRMFSGTQQCPLVRTCARLKPAGRADGDFCGRAIRVRLPLESGQDSNDCQARFHFRDRRNRSLRCFALSQFSSREDARLFGAASSQRRYSSPP